MVIISIFSRREIQVYQCCGLIQPLYLGNVNDILILMIYSSPLYLYNMTATYIKQILIFSEKKLDQWNFTRCEELERLCLIFIIFFKVVITAVITQRSDLVNRTVVPGKNKDWFVFLFLDPLPWPQGGKLDFCWH